MKAHQIPATSGVTPMGQGAPTSVASNFGRGKQSASRSSRVASFVAARRVCSLLLSIVRFIILDKLTHRSRSDPHPTKDVSFAASALPCRWFKLNGFVYSGKDRASFVRLSRPYHTIELFSHDLIKLLVLPEMSMHLFIACYCFGLTRLGSTPR